MASSKESAPESEEQKFKVKCMELRKRISEMEESNEISTLALSRTRMSIRRLRLEYAVLLERLESHVVRLSEEGNSKLGEAMARPFSPLLVDDNLEDKLTKVKTGRPKKGSGMSRAAMKRAARDPNLPKRPTNAYLMFCDREKDRVRAELERQNPGQPATELTRALTDAWKLLTEEQKVPYLELYEIDRERYQREMMVYNQQKHDEALGKSSSATSMRATLAQAGSPGSIEPETPTEHAEDVDLNEENIEENIDENIEENNGDDNEENNDDADDMEDADDDLDGQEDEGNVTLPELKREADKDEESNGASQDITEGSGEKRRKLD